MPGAGTGARPARGAPPARGAVAGSGENAATWAGVRLWEQARRKRCSGPICGERETRPSWCEALAAPGAAVCWGFTAVYVETRLGKGKEGGTSVARCQSRFAWPSRSSLLLLLPAPSNALKSHFQARHRINLWALHIAGSAKQDVGSFFSLSLRLG